MRTLITGGAGYVGSACLRWLVARGHRVLAFDNLSEGHRAAVAGSELVVGDLEDKSLLAEVMGSFRPDAVMHFAAAASVPESIESPELYYRSNVIGTKNVLDAMRAGGARRIVFSSTAAVYAFDQQMPLTEESHQHPQVPYGATKLAAEWLIKDYAKAYGLGYSILRYFNACGADRDGHHGEAHRRETHLIPLVLQVPLGRREEVEIFGTDFDTRDGTCVRDYIHVEDLARAHQLVLESLEPSTRQEFNVGTGTGHSVLEVLRVCEEVVGEPIPHRRSEPRPGDPATLVASPDRLRAELGWTPEYVDLARMVETAWRWHSAHPRGYETQPRTIEVD